MNNNINNNTDILDKDIANEADAASDAPKRRRFNVLPKIVCLLFAVIIWYYVMQVDNPDYKHTFSGVSVNLLNTDELTGRGLSIFNGSSYSADITVSGKKSVINNYSNEDITVKADIMKNYVTAGMQVVDLDVTLPSGLTLVSQDNTISVFVDEKTSMKIPVTVDQRTGATTSADYEAGILTSEYSEITVKGPKTIIDNIDHATVKADFSSFGVLESTITTDGTVYLYNKSGEVISSSYITIDYPTMKVTYPIYLSKSVPVKVAFKYVYFNDSNVTVAYDPDKLTIKGDASKIKNIDSIEIGVIDEKQIDKDKTLTFGIAPEDDYKVVDDVNAVRVTISNTGTTTKTYKVENLKVVGNSKASAVNEYVNVTLRGSAAALSSITADKITLTCDISDYDGKLVGEYELDAEVSISGSPSGVWEIGTYKMTVSVSE